MASAKIPTTRIVAPSSLISGHHFLLDELEGRKAASDASRHSAPLYAFVSPQLPVTKQGHNILEVLRATFNGYAPSPA
jgi:hypothetical protein